MDGTGREDDLVFGADSLHLATGDRTELDSGDVLPLVDNETGDLVTHEEVQVPAVIGDGGVVADAGMRPLDGLGILGRGDPAEAVLVAGGAVPGGFKTELLKALPSDF